MHVSSLDLEEFRLYRNLSIAIPPNGLRIVGQNATGKSTLVEAVALLATMRSPRTGSDRELIRWESGIDLGFPPYARASATVNSNSGETEITGRIASRSYWRRSAQEECKNQRTASSRNRRSGSFESSSIYPGRRCIDLRTSVWAAPIPGPVDFTARQPVCTVPGSVQPYHRATQQSAEIVQGRKSLVRFSHRTTVVLERRDGHVRRIHHCSSTGGLRRYDRTGGERFNEFSSGGELELAYRCTVSTEISDEAILTAGTEQARDRVQRCLNCELGNLELTSCDAGNP